MRAGKDARIPPARKSGAEQHTLPNVYGEMLLQICRDYPGLPDVRDLSQRQIRYFYEGLREELHARTMPRKS